MPIKGKPRLMMQRIKREKTRNMIKKIDKIKKKRRNEGDSNDTSEEISFSWGAVTISYDYCNWAYSSDWSLADI